MLDEIIISWVDRGQGGSGEGKVAIDCQISDASKEIKIKIKIKKINRKLLILQSMDGKINV